MGARNKPVMVRKALGKPKERAAGTGSVGGSSVVSGSAGGSGGSGGGSWGGSVIGSVLSIWYVKALKWYMFESVSFSLTIDISVVVLQRMSVKAFSLKYIKDGSAVVLQRMSVKAFSLGYRKDGSFTKQL
jgi:hypothetical protein